MRLARAINSYVPRWPDFLEVACGLARGAGGGTGAP